MVAVPTARVRVDRHPKARHEKTFRLRAVRRCGLTEPLAWSFRVDEPVARPTGPVIGAGPSADVRGAGQSDGLPFDAMRARPDWQRPATLEPQRWLM
jgi:hypothetical protein